MESKDGLTLDCDYNTGLFDEETIERWLEHYKVLLEGMAANADRPMSTLPLLSASDMRQLLESWNDTRVERQNGLTVHGLFEAQAEAEPGFGRSRFWGKAAHLCGVGPQVEPDWRTICANLA